MAQIHQTSIKLQILRGRLLLRLRTKTACIKCSHFHQLSHYLGMWAIKLKEKWYWYLGRGQLILLSTRLKCKTWAVDLLIVTVSSTAIQTGDVVCALIHSYIVADNSYKLVPDNERTLSTWIYKHDFKEALKKKKKGAHIQSGFLYILLAICLWFLKGVGVGQRSAKCFSLDDSCTRKASRAGVWANIFKWVHKIRHPWNLQWTMDKTEHLLCKVKFNYPLNCYVPNIRATFRSELSVPWCRSQFI